MNSIINRGAAVASKSDASRKAVCYYRMSSKAQDGSIEQQRTEVQKLAEREGFEIVREYVDEGKSGSKDTEKLTAFHAMLADAKLGGFDYILCWNTSRFGRLDTIDGSFAKSILRTHGVKLFTVKEGLIDWNTFAGRIQDSIFAELNNLYSQNLAADSLRGRVALLEAGFWPNGSVPYGYDRQYISPGGEARIVKRTEQFNKPSKAWKLKLVINDDEAAVVRLIFDLYANQDKSMQSIVGLLNEKGIASPRRFNVGTGRAWTMERIDDTMTELAYVGIGYIGGDRGGKRGKFVSAERQTKPDVCPIIVHEALWHAAQQKREKNKRTKRRSNRNSGALSGCVLCEVCGHRMHATHWKGRLKYVCGSGTWKKGATACRQWSIEEDDLLPVVCRWVVQMIDEELAQALEVKPEVAPQTDFGQLLDEIRVHEAKMERAKTNYLLADAELQPMLLDALRQMKQQLADMQGRYERLGNQSNTSGVQHFADWWRESRDKLIMTADGDRQRAEVAGSSEPPTVTGAADEYIYLAGEDGGILTTPDHVRSLLHRLGCQAACSFVAAPSKKKQTPGRGRGKSYRLTRLRLGVNTKDTEVSASRRSRS